MKELFRLATANPASRNPILGLASGDSWSGVVKRVASSIAGWRRKKHGYIVSGGPIRRGSAGAGGDDINLAIVVDIACGQSPNDSAMRQACDAGVRVVRSGNKSAAPGADQEGKCAILGEVLARI